MQRQIARELEVEARQTQHAQVRNERARKKEIDDAERRAGLGEADQQNARLAARITELDETLHSCVAAGPVTVDDIIRVEVPTFDPGELGNARPAPRQPKLEDGGLFSVARRRRELAVAMDRYKHDLAEYERRERSRVAELDSLRRAYDERMASLLATAAKRGERFRAGLRDGVDPVIEEYAECIVSALAVPDGVDLQPRVAYRPEPRELVVEVQLPDVSVIPDEKTVSYIHARRIFKVKNRSRTEMADVYRRLLAQLPLCVLQTLFTGLDRAVLDSATVNGVLPTVDPATGQPTTRYLVSVTSSRSTFETLVLDALDPVACLRHLGAKLSPNPLDYESVPPFLSFDLAKYRLGDSVDVASGLDGRANLLNLDPFDFEQLIRQLLAAMIGGDARVTRRARDDGIDGVLFDCDAVMGGEVVVQAKRYRNVVPANDVRALAGVMHDKRANHAIFVTSSWFSDDGRRFALDNRVRLIEGPELKHLLKKHLEVDVLIPSAPRRSNRGSCRSVEGRPRAAGA
jgi:restriction system protein